MKMKPKIDPNNDGITRINGRPTKLVFEERPMFINADGEVKCEVIHQDEVYPIWAVSPEDARNKIRYMLYGETPEWKLPPFEVWAVMEKFPKYVPLTDMEMGKGVINGRIKPILTCCA